jgi:hypothetical protein
MASERRTDTTRSTNGHDHTGADPAAVARDVAGRTAEVAGDVASRTAEVAGDMASRLPAAAASTRDVLTEAQARMNSSSDEVLTNGTMLSLGVALGLLLGGANRLLVALALIPAAAMGATLIDRRSRS